MKKRFLSALLALGLVAGLFAGALTTGYAQAPEADYEDFASAIFYPSVHDGANIGDTGPWYSNITVQNIEEARVFLEFSSYAGGAVHRTASLNPYASTTFRADQVLDGATTGPVVVTAYWHPLDVDNAPCEEGLIETTEIVTRGTGPADSFTAPGEVVGTPTTDPTGGDVSVVGDSTINIVWSDGGPAPGSAYEVTYTYIGAVECEREPAIAGYAKQSAGVPMTGTSRTSSSHNIVDGYTAIPLADVAWGPSTEFSNFGFSILGIPLGAFIGLNWDGHSYLPILQNNAGWDTVINVSNIDGDDTSDNASVSVRTFRSGGPGQAGQADGNIQINLGRGETRTITLADLGITEDGYTGGVWIESDYGVVATAERYKSETNMLIINQSAPSLWAFNVEAPEGEFGPPESIGAGFPEIYEAHAPLVFSGYHGWNSGFSVVNIAEITNTVNVEVLNESGTTVFADQLTIQPKSQQFIYIPHVAELGVPGSEFVGSALFSSVLPFHASVDQVKYETGEAMSYIATQSGAEVLAEGQEANFLSLTSKLAFPLIQKGTNDGVGDTSGIQLLNGTLYGNAHARIMFFSGSGAAAPPTTNFGLGFPVNLGPRANATVYTLSLSGMDTNTSVSAVAFLIEGPGTPLASRGVLYGVTNNVNYSVDGDGSTSFNAVNAYGQFRTWSGPWFAGGIFNDE